MINYFKNIEISENNLPFASAIKHSKLAQHGYEEEEYFFKGTSNIYGTTNHGLNVHVKTKNAPYTDRLLVRRPKDNSKFSGNVFVEILNSTAGFDIDRMWIQGKEKFMRDGDIYVGFTSKPNVLPALRRFNEQRYSELAWPNPTPDEKFDFELSDLEGRLEVLPEFDPKYETGMLWDIISDLAWYLRSDKEDNPLKGLGDFHEYLIGHSQSACCIFRYVRNFAYSDENRKYERPVYDGYMAAAAPRRLIVPVNQYESNEFYDALSINRLDYCTEPFIAVQTESDAGHWGDYKINQHDSDDPDCLYRIYDITGTSHDNKYVLLDYYEKDPDMKRAGVLPDYTGEGYSMPNNYPSMFIFNALLRNLIIWDREKIGPNHIGRMEVDGQGNEVKDALGVTKGGIRTALLDYPTCLYDTLSIGKDKKGNRIENPAFGTEKPLPKAVLKQMYGNLKHYQDLVTKETKKNISQGFICPEDKDAFIKWTVDQAKEFGLGE